MRIFSPMAGILPLTRGKSWNSNSLPLQVGVPLLTPADWIAVLVWVSCYASTVPWMAMDADPPILTASVASVGAVAVLIAYCALGSALATRGLRAEFIKA